MKIHTLVYLMLFIPVLFESCKKETIKSSDATFYGGVLSSDIISYSANNMTLKMNFFVAGTGDLAALTESDISGSLNISSTIMNGVLQDLHKVNTTPTANYSCAILVDSLFNVLSYDNFDDINNTEIFIRKFFKTAGVNNKFLFSVFEKKSPPVKIYGNGFTDNAASLDQLLATRLNDVKTPSVKADSVPLIKSLDYMLDYINENAPAGNRNILLLSSTSAYNLNSTATAQLIGKATTLGISISTFLFVGDISYFTWDMDHDDIYYRLAYATGGSVYKSRYSIYAGDILDLASPLKNIMNKDYSCFEATWELIPINQYYTTFYPGYFEKPDLEIALQTGSGKKIFDMPFGIIIK